jgi:hypothetical protein
VPDINPLLQFYVNLCLPARTFLSQNCRSHGWRPCMRAAVERGPPGALFAPGERSTKPGGNQLVSPNTQIASGLVLNVFSTDLEVF